MLKQSHIPAVIKKDLEMVRTMIDECLQVENKEISQALLNLHHSGGKMIRPSLVLLFAKLFDTPKVSKENLYKLAASLEILHLATLIHDDIIDDSPLRRTNSSLQSKYGKDIAVYAGDLLFTIHFELICEIPFFETYFAKHAQAMKKILLGELGQMTQRFNVHLAMDTYFENISGKTGELFALCCEEGAYFGGASAEMVKIARLIGENIGLTFQILDDILDYTSSEDELKKPVLEDLSSGIYTLPLLLAIQNGGVDIFSPILEKKTPFSKAEIQQLKKLVLQYEGVTTAKKIAQEKVEVCLQLLERFPSSPAKKVLALLIQELQKRSF